MLPSVFQGQTCLTSSGITGTHTGYTAGKGLPSRQISPTPDSEWTETLEAPPEKQRWDPLLPVSFPSLLELENPHSRPCNPINKFLPPRGPRTEGSCGYGEQADLPHSTHPKLTIPGPSVTTNTVRNLPWPLYTSPPSGICSSAILVTFSQTPRWSWLSGT